MTTKLQWKHKDGSRYYWTVTAEATADTRQVEGLDVADREWAVSVEMEDHLVFDSFIYGQGDDPITVENIMSEFLAHLTYVAMGFAKFDSEPVAEEKD